MNANVVTALKFEEFVLSVLKQICIKENKPIFTCYDVNQCSKDDYNFSYVRNMIVHGHARFDAYMPKGFSTFDCPVIVEIKYNISSRMFDDLMPSNDDHISLYIVGSPKNPKELNNRIKGKNVIIWGEEIISKWKKEYAVDYYGLFSENEPEESFIEFKKKNEANKNLLLHTVQEKNLSLALGAGVSMDFGALKWTDLIESFYTEIQSDNKIDNAKAVQEKIGGTSIINGQFTEDNLKDFMNSLYNGIYSYYNPNNDYHDSTIAHLIPLVKKLHSARRFNIITYNYDNYLEKFLDYEFIPYNILYSEDGCVDEKLNIYHPHGFLPYDTKKNSYPSLQKYIVFSENEYHNLYNNPYSWASILQYFLYRESLYLFVGCSLSDPNLRRILSATKIKGKNHFALMLTDGLSKKDQFIVHRHFMRIGVECIWANNINDYKQIIDYISR